MVIMPVIAGSLSPLDMLDTANVKLKYKPQKKIERKMKN